jgi:hypothetical protein
MSFGYWNGLSVGGYPRGRISLQGQPFQGDLPAALRGVTGNPQCFSVRIGKGTRLG